MKQVLCLLILFVCICLTSTGALAQMGGYAANSSSLTKVQQKKHKQKKSKSAYTRWVARAFGENISIAKMERKSRKKLHEAQLRDRQREEESGVAEFFNKRHVSNPKKALKEAKKRDHEREKNSGVAAFFEDEHVSDSKKNLKEAKKRDRKREKYSGVNEYFKN
ncbi:MAG: hypothetical protein JNM36_06595 [Chitinophagales bacterium]|nr:hypothetical protein [Chitinophagales bacterium]